MDWINVKHRLPEMEERVLLLNFSKYPKIKIGRFSHINKWGNQFVADDGSNHAPEYWMPLPEWNSAL